MQPSILAPQQLLQDILLPTHPRPHASHSIVTPSLSPFSDTEMGTPPSSTLPSEKWVPAALAKWL